MSRRDDEVVRKRIWRTLRMNMTKRLSLDEIADLSLVYPHTAMHVLRAYTHAGYLDVIENRRRKRFFRLRADKNSGPNAPLIQRAGARVVDMNTSFVWDAAYDEKWTPKTGPQRVIEVLKDSSVTPVSARKISTLTGLCGSAVRRVLHDLEAQQRISKSRKQQVIFYELRHD